MERDIPSTLKQVIADALEQQLGPEGIYKMLMERLFSRDVLGQLVLAGAQALDEAARAADLRDDIYEFDFSERAHAQVFANALRMVLAAEDAPRTPDVPPQQGAAQLARVTYKPGWEFVLTKLPDETLGVCAKAQVPDTRNPSRVFSVGRSAAAQGDVYAAAFAAVMMIEEHEAGEWFRVGGRPWRDPHHAHPGEPTADDVLEKKT